MIDDDQTLLNRIADDPILHLGRNSAQLIAGYELGYEFARARWAMPPLKVALGAAWYRSVQQRFGWTDEMGCRQNPVSFALLMTSDESAAFDFYVDLRAAGLRELGDSAAEELGFLWPTGGLFQFLQDDYYWTRPRMHLGCASLDAFWAFCSGYWWAERDIGIAASEGERLLKGFQDWLDVRYPFAKGRRWCQTFSFLTLDQFDQASKAFRDALALYLADEPPTAPSQTARIMCASIVRNMLADNPTLSESEVADYVEQLTRGIAIH